MSCIISPLNVRSFTLPRCQFFYMSRTFFPAIAAYCLDCSSKHTVAMLYREVAAVQFTFTGIFFSGKVVQNLKY